MGLIEELTDYMEWPVIVVWFFIAVGVAFVVINNSNVTLDFVKDLSNACLTISSISLATILAFFAIIATKMNSGQIKKLPIGLIIIPILGAFLGLFALYFAYFNLNSAKILLAISMEFTVGNFLVLYSLVEKQKSLKWFGSPDN